MSSCKNLFYKKMVFCVALGWVPASAVAIPLKMPLSNKAQSYMLDPERRIEAQISATHLNRIQVGGDRIAAVYGVPNNVSNDVSDNVTLEPDEVGGQLFIKVHGSNSFEKTPLYLTLITEGGFSQDLKLILHESEAQTLIFKSSSEEENFSNFCSSETLRSNILGIMHALVHGVGKNAHDYQANPRISPHPDLVFTAQKKVSREGIIGYTFEVLNQGQQEVILNEALFAKPGDLCLAFEQSTLRPGLKPGEKTKAYIVSKGATK